MIFRCATLGFLILAASVGEARVFDFNSEKMATYFGGSFGTTQLNATPYDISSGSGVHVDKKSSTGESGEVGFLFSGQKLSFKIGVEMLIPQHQSSITGTGASGATYFSLDSQTLAYVPSLAIEYQAYRAATSHALLGAGVGYAFVSMQNKYTMTTAGTSALGLPSYTEAARARTLAVQMYGGFETVFTDTVTLSLKAGYRYLPVKSLTSTQATTAAGGTETTGSALVNMDGSARRLDLSGGYVGLDLNFYL